MTRALITYLSFIFFLSLLLASSSSAAAIVNTTTTDDINCNDDDDCESLNIDTISDEVSFFNATMTRLKNDDSICAIWTAANHYDEHYNVSIMQYHNNLNNSAEILSKRQQVNYFDTIRLILPPKYLTSLCDDEINTVTMEDWWNSTMDNNHYNDSSRIHGEYCNSDSFYDDAFFVRPLHTTYSSENNEYSDNDMYYCSLSVILSNVQKINNNIASFNKTALLKTRTIIMNEELVTKDDIEYITLHNIHLLDHIQIIFVPHPFFIHIDNDIHFLQSENIDLMSPYYMDPLSVHWNLTYEFMEILSDIDDDGTTDIIILNDSTISSSTLSPQQLESHSNRTRMATVTWLMLFCLVSILFVLLLTTTSYIPADTSISEDTSTLMEEMETKPVQSIEDRKHDFDALPKIHYHHHSCTLNKRRLMTEDDSILKQVENSTSSDETENTSRNDDSDQVDVPFGNYMRTDQVISNNFELNICQHNNQEHNDSSQLEMKPAEIIYNDIENIQENVAEDSIITDDSSSCTNEELRNSFKQFSLVYIPTIDDNNITNYDDDDDINNHFYHEECPICFDRYEPNEIVILLPHCHHMYHVHCLEEWFMHRKSNLCPLCKTPIIVDVESSVSDD